MQDVRMRWIVGSVGGVVLLGVLIWALFQFGIPSDATLQSGSGGDPQRVLSVGVAIGRGGLGDRSFNDSANEGLQQAQRDFGVRSRIIELERDTQEANLRTLASEGHDLIIALGQEYVGSLATVAAEFPDQRFAIVDSEVAAPNITSITFRELEGDFLAGALAALLSENDTVGFLGGADIVIIRRIEHGWAQGVRHVKPDAVILAEYAGGVDDFSAFGKPELGLELTTTMFDGGANVVYAAAGRTALGAIDAAEQNERVVITTGTDQRWIAPEFVATSRTKNMDVAIYTLISELHEGTLEAETRVLGLNEGGVGLAPLEAPLISPEIVEQVEMIRGELMSGAIIVEEFPSE